MKEIRKSSQFKKDYKRIKNNKILVDALYQVIGYLANDLTIPKKYNPHPLIGNWKNYMECHIANDSLLIWFNKTENVIELVRFGSHSELFGKGKKK